MPCNWGDTPNGRGYWGGLGDYLCVATGYEGLAFPQFSPAPGCFWQRANEVLDYVVDWSGELQTGDAIVSSSWSGDVGLTLGDLSYTASSATVWVSGGTAYYRYRVLNTIVTSGGRTLDREWFFTILPAVV